MNNFKDAIGKVVIIGDGAYGTLLQNKISGSFVPEELNLSRPEWIREIHREYAASGAQFLTSHTFGANELKLREVSLEHKFVEINQSAVRIAREVAQVKNIWVAGNISASGQLIEPLGPLDFQEAVKTFTAQAKILEGEGVDFILIETMTEIQEFRAAVIACLDAVHIPVVATMSFTDDDRTMSGTSARGFAVTSNFIGLSAVGANCGTSLESMTRVMGQILSSSPLPVICQANAGIPAIEKGRTVFKVSADDYADFMEPLVAEGVAVVGSCCGSTPEFTRVLSERFKNKEVRVQPRNRELILTSRTGVQRVSDDRLFVLGERINPTGRKKLRQELESGKLTTLRLDALEQERSGSQALDINVNLHKLDQRIVRNIILSLQHTANIPMAIDSTDFQIIEEFCRLYPGKGLINSISGERHSYEKILPIAKKYNMAFIAALIDDEGIPESAEGRLAIAEQMVEHAAVLEIPRENIIFDPLVLSAGAEIGKVHVTLDTITALKKTFPMNKTIIGLSNISFGLPNRELINATFLAMAAARGLDMVIANPLHESFRHTLAAVNFLKSGSKTELSKYTELFTGFDTVRGERLTSGSSNLIENIQTGDADSAETNVKEILETVHPLDIVKEYIMPAMAEVGRRYQEKEFFLPQLIAAADAVKRILPVIKEKLPSHHDSMQPAVVFATVKGDIHDIGKNIVIGVLESFNFRVIDLGKDVAPEKVVSETAASGAGFVGLSTLMTTTVPRMIDTIEQIRKNPATASVTIFIGGAVINSRIAEENGVHYAKDGMDMVNRIQAMG